MSDLKHGIKLKLSQESHFDLAEIIAAIGEDLLAKLSWKVEMGFFVIHRESEFAQISQLVDPWPNGWCHRSMAKRSWTFDQLMRFSREKHQVVDSEFIGFKPTPKGKKKWIVIKAVDISWWEVWSADRKLLSKVQAAFPGAEELGSGLPQ
jgi:hypothetical protein